MAAGSAAGLVHGFNVVGRPAVSIACSTVGPAGGPAAGSAGCGTFAASLLIRSGTNGADGATLGVVFVNVHLQ